MSAFRRARLPWTVASALVLSFCVLHPLAILPALANPGGLVILAFGDSFTAGLGIPRELAFPALLETSLRAHGYDARVINAGVSGDTTAAAVARLENALAVHPNIVIIELGANDALRGIQPAVARANLHKIIAAFKGGGAAVLLTGMRAPPNWGEEYQQAFNRIYPELAAAATVPLYPFFLNGVALSRDLNQHDTLHPNERGVAEIVRRMTPLMIELFFKAPQDKGIGPLSR